MRTAIRPHPPLAVAWILALAPLVGAQTADPGPTTSRPTRPVTPPTVTLAPELAFGPVRVADAAALDATVAASLREGATVTAVEVVGQSAGDFAWSTASAPPFPLAAGASEPITVTFTPSAKGERLATLVVRTAEAPDYPVAVPLAGVGVGPVGAETLVNAGGFEEVGALGSVWSSDFGFVGGSVAFKHGTYGGIPDKNLYVRQRTGGSFTYALPLVEPGWYELTLHFAEQVHTAPGLRVFDVTAEGVLVVDDLDVYDKAGLQTPTTETALVHVADAVLDLAFVSSVGEAAVAKIELRGTGVLDVSPLELDLPAVASGSQAQAALTLQNDGLLPVTIDTVSWLVGQAGTPASMSVELDGVDYDGAAAGASYPAAIVLDPAEVLAGTITFAPTTEQYDEAVLRLEGDFGTTDVVVSGLGGHVGHPFLHVVIDVPPYVVDYDGTGAEDVVLDGSGSHTHEPGGNLVGWTWSEGGGTIATDPVAVASFALGQHTLELEIEDANVPPETLSDSVTFDVLPPTAIPGVMVQYFDAAGGSPIDLLYASLQVPDRAEVVPTTYVDGGATVGGSPFDEDVVVRFLAELELPADGTYELKASGGVVRLVAIEGLQFTGPAWAPAGTYSLEARFAVEDASQQPLRVDVSVDGGPFETIAEAWTSHDASGLPPVINEMPTVGVDLGGNDVRIEGTGFFPADAVVVHWGPDQLSGDDLDSVTPTEIRLTSPPGSGSFQVRVETPQGTSNDWPWTYDVSGPVPIQFLEANSIPVHQPSCAAWGPDGRLYLGRLDGQITALELDADYQVVSEATYTGVKGTDQKWILGLAFDPRGPVDPPELYVAHTKLWAQGGSSFTGPAPYPGRITKLVGPTFKHNGAGSGTVVTNLPTSNHDHGINGMTFDLDGDLLVAVGGNTNAGVKHPNIGDLPESPLTAAVIKVGLSRPTFSGQLSYVDSLSGIVDLDQVHGNDVDLAPGTHVWVHAPGLRNSYDLVYTTSRLVYATDNGPNFGFGAASTGPASQGPDPQTPDELVLVRPDAYYGHPNRSRGRYDARQNVYYGTSGAGSLGTFTQALSTPQSSTNGIDEYRAQTFQGQLRGDLIVQKYNGWARRVELSADGTAVTKTSDLVWTAALDVLTGPGGALLAIANNNNLVRVYVPDDASAVGTIAHDVFPWRGPEEGGTPFVIGGVGFGTLANTTVEFGGIPATVTAVSPTRIEGLAPANLAHGEELADVTVRVGSTTTTTIPKAWRWLNPPGEEPGVWETLPSLPTSLGEVSAGVIGGVLYVLGESSNQTLRYDLASGAWLSNAAVRPFPGHHHAAEVYDGKLWLFGGLGGGSEGKVQVYDPATDSWSTKTAMPWAGGSVNTARIDGRIHVAGGIVGNVTVSNHSVYDPATDGWSTLAPMPVGRNHAATGTDGRRMFVFGGRDGGNWVSNGFDDVQVYDPATGAWQWSGDGVSGLAPLPQARGGTGKAVWYDGEFYVLGGETFDGPGATASKVYTRVDVYDPSADLWTTDTPMPNPRHGIFPVLFQGRILVAGGGIAAGGSKSKIFDQLVLE